MNYLPSPIKILIESYLFPKMDYLKEFPKEIRNLILQYLNNQNWLETQLSSKLFHVSTEREIERRKYLQKLAEIRGINKIKIKNFDIKNINDNSISIIIAKRGTGKGILVRDLLYYKKHISNGIVISPTDHIEHIYDNFIDPKFIHENYQPEILKNILQRQKKLGRNK